MEREMPLRHIWEFLRAIYQSTTFLLNCRKFCDSWISLLSVCSFAIARTSPSHETLIIRLMVIKNNCYRSEACKLTNSKRICKCLMASVYTRINSALPQIQM